MDFMNVENRQFELTVPLTHSDWMMREAPGITWGEEGIKYMLDTCKATGWSKVYWRALSGGRSNYKSKLVTPGMHMEYDQFYNPVTEEGWKILQKYGPDVTAEERKKINEQQVFIDYSEFDSLAVAVEYGRKIGLEIHAWITINEDDHGYGCRSDFSLKNPEYRWRRRDGRFYRSQISFAFEEAMEYKVGIVKELVENYDLNGLFFDWIRTGDVLDDPQGDDAGSADRGYETPLVESFKKKFGIDPHCLPNNEERWTRHRADPHTEFMRRVDGLRKAKGGDLPVSVLVWHPWAYRAFKYPINGNLQGMHLDVTTWAREGLIDQAIPAGYYMNEGTASMAYNALKEETEHRIDIGLFSWIYESVEEFEKDAALARDLGATTLLLWEADYIDYRKERAAIQDAMKRAVKYQG